MSADIVNEFKFCYLLNLAEPKDNTLRLTLVEAGLGPILGEDDLASIRTASMQQLDAAPDLDDVDRAQVLEGLSISLEMARGGRFIMPLPGGRIAEVEWPSYYGYAVRDESVAHAADDQSSDGRLSRMTNSAFLRYITSTTSDWKGNRNALIHWQVATENHLVDVVSEDEPVCTITMRDMPCEIETPNFAVGGKPRLNVMK